MSVVAAVQSTVAVVALTAIATGLVAAPLVSCRGRLTHLLNRAGALSTSWDTAVAVAVVTAVACRANLAGAPLVTREGRGAAFHVAVVAATGSRSTGVAEAVVAAEATGTGLRGGVARAIGRTGLDIAARASLGTGHTCTTGGGTGGSCAQVSSRVARGATGVLLGTVTEGTSRCTVHTTDLAVAVPVTGAAIATGDSRHPLVSTSRRVTSLSVGAVTAIAAEDTGIAVSVGTSG